MASTPVEHLKEIQDSLRNLPERLAAVLARSQGDDGGGSDPSQRNPGRVRDWNGRFLKMGEEPRDRQLPDKWRSTERLLSAGGNFLPFLSSISTHMRNIRELKESYGQFREAFGGSQSKTLPASVATATQTLPTRPPRPLPTMRWPDATGLEEEQQRGANYVPWGMGRGTLAPPVQTRKVEPPYNPHPKTGFDFGAAMMKALEENNKRLAENTEALKANAVDTSEDSDKAPGAATESKQESSGKAASALTEGSVGPTRQGGRLREARPWRPQGHVPSKTAAEAGSQAAEAAEVAEIL